MPRDYEAAVRISPLLIAVASFAALELQSSGSWGPGPCAHESSPATATPCAAATAAGAFTWLAVLGVVLPAPLSHVAQTSAVLGVPGFRLFMPFRGGFNFVMLQAIG